MIDLHVHTTNSDGDFTTKETLIEAQKQGIEILSIADHNNITAYEELKSLPLQDLFHGTIIMGVELEFTKDGRIFEMLGYGFDYDKLKNTEIIRQGMVHATIEGETKILNELKSICDKLNIKYSKELSITRPNYMANDVLLDNILTYDENQNILKQLGIHDRGSFYREHFCEPTSPFYINQSEGKFDVFYVVKTIRDAGGKTFLAHPFSYKLPDLKKFLDELVSYNLLDGIECEHRKNTLEEIEWLKKYCDEHGLLKSGGSDRHTESQFMGYSNNNKKPIDKSLVQDWISDITPVYSLTNAKGKVI
ncbi:MAG: PHP domain-containing protein [Mollicutes bacterium]|nr:PHP domain-containing protein [Mollicutes bacterium]